MPKSSKGFTLVELLVVIAIIAVLSVIGVTVFSGIQNNARDSKRKADVNAIIKAYEVRYSSSGSYGDTLMEGTAFASGSLPIPPEGGNYTIMQDKTTKGIKVCAALEASPQRYCTETSDNCSCKGAVQETPPSGTTNITYLAGGPDGSGGGGLGLMGGGGNPPPSAKAMGGTNTQSGGYTIHTFTSSGTFTANKALTAEVLVVGGGGGGAWGIPGVNEGGGGGAGGVVSNNSMAVFAGSSIITLGTG